MPLTRPRPDIAGPGQESVWAFPRPAVAEPSAAHLVITLDGEVLAQTHRAVRTLETSHPPSWYIPPKDIRDGALRRAVGRSLCEWKGEAVYWDVILGDGVIPRAGWSYPAPTPPFALLRDHVAFYAGPFECRVDGERVTPQPGRFYGGWITNRLAGPFKGVPGSDSW